MNVVPATHIAKKLAIHIGAGSALQVGTMLARQNLRNLSVSQRELPSATIGCLGAALPLEGNVCFFTGLPIHGPAIRDIVDAESAARLFPQYDGAFTGVFWDAQQQVLVVATDCLGMQPLYVRYADGELTLTTETKAIAGDPDLAAWGAFISMGHPIGERTLMSGLRHVPPASILTYDYSTRRLEIRRYWQWPTPSDAWRNYDFLGSLEQDMRAYAAFGNSGTVLLSGGFDSRLLLFLLRRANIPVDALIVAHEDEYADADGRLAEAVAMLAGVPFRKAHPAADFFSSRAYLEHLQASDAGYPSMDLFIAKVAPQIDATAVWEGLVPAFAFNTPHQEEGGFDSYKLREVRDPTSAVWRAAKTLFKPDAIEAMLGGFSDDLHNEISRVPQDMAGVLQFIVEHRSRNRTGMNPMKVFSNRTKAFTPGLSKDLMAHAATIPFKERQNAQFYKGMLGRLDKRMLAIPFVSGGELVKGVRFSPSYYRERARAEYLGYRARHPRLFIGSRERQPEYSAFLGANLFEEDDKWLNPGAREQMKTVSADNYLAWKLLFHWKTWQWVHKGTLVPMLGTYASRGSNHALPE
ncbi:hypothetical protein PY254_01430 [Rhodanobacter sp. AS-Z3]|uniref:hypothetical protein n=1 Tax=Rhodanobacter sp. AS-Z3 TaxID=3031330 RepID=UPI002478A801|nr:hypothetical protein [Rhodanobacter sp. AS-Z3]WEN15370.1 hypothetical protein PY254_01430 [Rhodanobacter sp. AS-Z3]